MSGDSNVTLSVAPGTNIDTSVTEQLAALQQRDDISDMSVDDITEQPGGLILRGHELNKSLTSLSASVIGRLATGFSAAVQPLKRSPRVGLSPVSEASDEHRAASPRGFTLRPVMPGYSTLRPGSDSSVPPTTVVQQTVSQVESTQTDTQPTGDVGLRQAIPVMPRSLAFVCCLLNILSPGLGTFVSGLSLLSCATTQQPNADKSNLLLVNIWVALFQLLTSFLLLLGWIWSLIWAFRFIAISDEARSKRRSDEITDDTTNSQQQQQQTTTRTTTTTTTTMTTTTLTSHAVDAEWQQDAAIIVLQEAPFSLQSGTDLDLQLSVPVGLHRPSHWLQSTAGQSVEMTTEPGATNTHRQRLINRRRHRRQHQTAAGEWSDQLRRVDQLTGVLLCPQALERIIIHGNVVPDPETHDASGSTTNAAFTKH